MEPHTEIVAGSNSRSPWMTAAWTTGGVLALLLIAALFEGLASLKLFPALFAIGLLLYAYLVFLFTDLSDRLRIWVKQDVQRCFFLAALLVVPFWVFSRGTDSFSYWGFIKFSCFVYFPTYLMYRCNFADQERPSWHWYAAIACLWLPFDFRLLDNIWNWPAGVGGYSINTLVAILTAILAFRVIGNLSGMGLPLKLTSGDPRRVVAYTLWFCAFAVPIALDANFIKFSPTFAPWKYLITPLGIFFFVALPEELLFRGLLQNLLNRHFRNPVRAIGVTSLIFGLSHINNDPTWSLSYVGLATFAGFFYGTAYHRSQNLFAPALIHAAVDSIWILMFFGRGQ